MFVVLVNVTPPTHCYDRYDYVIRRSDLQDYVSAALLAATGASAGVLATVIYNYLTSPAPMLRHPATFTKAPLVVTVTGAAGQIGYSIIYMIGQGRMLGADQPIHLRLLDLPPMQPILNGVAMELDDCAFPIVSSVVCTADYQDGVRSVRYRITHPARAHADPAWTEATYSRRTRRYSKAKEKRSTLMQNALSKCSSSAIPQTPMRSSHRIMRRIYPNLRSPR